MFTKCKDQISNHPYFRCWIYYRPMTQQFCQHYLTFWQRLDRLLRLKFASWHSTLRANSGTATLSDLKIYRLTCLVWAWQLSFRFSSFHLWDGSVWVWVTPPNATLGMQHFRLRHTKVSYWNTSNWSVCQQSTQCTIFNRPTKSVWVRKYWLNW